MCWQALNRVRQRPGPGVRDTRKLLEKEQFKLIRDDRATCLSHRGSNSSVDLAALSAALGSRYVQTGPAICDDHHVCNRAWAVTIRWLGRRAVMQARKDGRRPMEGNWLALQRNEL